MAELYYGADANASVRGAGRTPRFAFPLAIPDPMGLSLLAFFVQHDSYHIGQLALLRKHAGLPAMQYA